MRMHLVPSALLTLALAFACDLSPAPAPPADGNAEEPVLAPPDSLRDQVLAVLEQYYADLSARDWPRFREHFWPGATLTTVWQPPGEPEPRVVTSSVDAFIQAAPQGPGSKPIFEEKMTHAEVRATGTVAQVWAHYQARFGEPGAIDEWTGVDAFTLLRHEGRWRIVALSYAAETPPSH